MLQRLSTTVLLIAMMLALGLVPALVSAQQRTRQSTGKSPPPQPEVLTNQSIIKMVNAKVSDDIIIAKIRQSKTRFDLSTDGIVQLKTEGVSDLVLNAMMSAPADPPKSEPPIKPPAVSPTPHTTKPNTPESGKSGTSASKGNPSSGGTSSSSTAGGKGRSHPLPPDKGAYLWDGEKMHLLYQIPVPSLGQNFWRKWTPFVKKKFELQLVDAYAKLRFNNPQPVILVSGLGEVIPGIPSYRLLYVKTGGMLKDRRIVGNYEVGGFFGSVRRVDNEVECEIKKLAEGIYAITPVNPLKDGEYGLVQMPKSAEVSSQPSFALPVWDFGIYVVGRPN